MRIQLERTGGVAGVRMAATIDSESLPEEEARQLGEVVDGAGFFDLPTEIAGSAPGADRFLYTLTVETEGRRHTVHAGETAASPELRSLSQWLTNSIRTARGSSRPS